jgi:hypothetical protein
MSDCFRDHIVTAMRRRVAGNFLNHGKSWLGRGLRPNQQFTSTPSWWILNSDQFAKVLKNHARKPCDLSTGGLSFLSTRDDRTSVELFWIGAQHSASDLVVLQPAASS